MAKLDLSLSSNELEAFLTDQRTVRLATVASGNRPQVVPLWYVWLEGTMFMNSTLGNLTLRNLEARPEAAAVVDDGDAYHSLRGAILRGPVELAEGDSHVAEVTDRWSVKYMGGGPVPYQRWRNRVWLRLRPDEVTSWDFRKIPDARAKRAAEEGR